MTLEQLEQTYRDYPVKFTRGQGNLPCIDIKTALAEARIYLHGAHVTHYQPAGQKPVLFMSNKSWFEPNKPIRGGIPICFPWFGPKADDPKAPAHGIARTQSWSVTCINPMATGDIEVTLEMLPSDISRNYGYGAFVAQYRVRVGRELSVALTVRNTGDHAFSYGEALHTYFSVGDVGKVEVTGLADTTYMDKTRNYARFTEGQAPITFTQEFDRLYLNTESTVILKDPSLGREILIGKTGSLSTVVWNPWVAKAKAMPDFGDEEWPDMLCVETANAADNIITLQPGESHETRATICVESL